MKEVTKKVNYKTGSISVKQGTKGFYDHYLPAVSIMLRGKDKFYKEHTGGGDANVSFNDRQFYFPSNKKASAFFEEIMDDIEKITEGEDPCLLSMFKQSVVKQ